MKATEKPALAKLPDAQRIGLRHHRHAAFEPTVGIGDLKLLHQQMQHQHPGNFIGVHPGLQVHGRSTAIALETPGTDLHRVAVIVANTERNILRHRFVLPRHPRLKNLHCRRRDW